MNLQPGSPQGHAPNAPSADKEVDDVDASIGGNMALGNRSGRSRSRMSRSRGSTKSRSRLSFGGGSVVGASRHGRDADDKDDEDDMEAGHAGRNAIPDDIAE